LRRVRLLAAIEIAAFDRVIQVVGLEQRGAQIHE
jgi:hypothetical protein